MKPCPLLWISPMEWSNSFGKRGVKMFWKQREWNNFWMLHRLVPRQLSTFLTSDESSVPSMASWCTSARPLADPTPFTAGWPARRVSGLLYNVNVWISMVLHGRWTFSAVEEAGLFPSNRMNSQTESEVSKWSIVQVDKVQSSGKNQAWKFQRRYRTLPNRRMFFSPLAKYPRGSNPYRAILRILMSTMNSLKYPAKLFADTLPMGGLTCNNTLILIP